MPIRLAWAKLQRDVDATSAASALIRLKLPGESQRLMLTVKDPLLRQAEKSLGIKCECALRVTGDAHNQVLRHSNSGLEPGKGWPRELVLKLPRQHAQGYPAGLYVGVSSGENEPAELFVFRNGIRGLELLRRRAVYGAYWNTVTLVDADRDGRLEIILAAQACDPGGAIQVWELEPDGKLRSELSNCPWARHDHGDRDGTLDSYEGRCDLYDFNADGRVEFATDPWIDSPGFAFCCIPTLTVLFTTDAQGSSWRACTAEHPNVAVHDRQMFEAFLAAETGDPATKARVLRIGSDGTQEFLLDGDWMTLTPIDPADLKDVLGNWDHSRFSGYKIDQR